MSVDTASAGTTPCTLEPRSDIWDLGGTMTAAFTDLTDSTEPVGFIDSDHVLQVTVTVSLTGKILNYLCGTCLCVCVAFEACGCGPSGDFYDSIKLDGDYSPCNTSQWVFTLDIPAYTFDPGKCGREYKLCITLGSKDCCDKVGFVFGSCHDYKITVSPPRQD